VSEDRGGGKGRGPRGEGGVYENFSGGRMGNSWEDMDMRRGLS
jgi:hypothetical protein